MKLNKIGLECAKSAAEEAINRIRRIEELMFNLESFLGDCIYDVKDDENGELAEHFNLARLEIEDAFTHVKSAIDQDLGAVIDEVEERL